MPDFAKRQRDSVEIEARDSAEGSQERARRLWYQAVQGVGWHKDENADDSTKRSEETRLWYQAIMKLGWNWDEDVVDSRIRKSQNSTLVQSDRKIQLK